MTDIENLFTWLMPALRNMKVWEEARSVVHSVTSKAPRNESD